MWVLFFFLMRRRPPRSTLFPSATLFRSGVIEQTAPGVFGPWTRVATAGPGTVVQSVVSGDFDDDGRVDLCWLQDGATTLLYRVLGTVDGCGPAASAPVTPDAIGLTAGRRAGGRDLVAVFSADTVEVWRIDAPIGPRLYTTTLGAGPPFRDVALRVGDSPSNIDLYAARQGGIERYKNVTGSGSPTPLSTIPIRSAGLVRILSADVDRDGAGDLLYWHTVSGSLNLLRSTADPVAVTPYCLQTVTNSLGVAATLDARALFGSYGITSNGVGLRLDAHDVPPGSAGMWLTSRTPGLLPLRAGELGLGGPFGRLNRPRELFVAGEGGAAGGVVALDALPLGGSIAPALRGETWSFQAWYRDVAPGGGGTNQFTDSVALLFR